MKYILFLGSLSLFGCVSIPNESVELSTELGKQITVIQKSNLALLDIFFEKKEQQIDDFIQIQWLPTFADNLLAQPEMIKEWSIVVKEDDKQQRLLFLLKIGTKLQTAINKKRMELIRPLTAFKQKAKYSTTDSYNHMLAINNSITSFLLSSTAVQKNYERYAELLKINDTKFVRKVDKALSWLENSEDKSNSIQRYLEALKVIKL